MTTPSEKLRDLGYTLPQPKAPFARYVPVVWVGTLLYISAQSAITVSFTPCLMHPGASTDAPMALSIRFSATGPRHDLVDGKTTLAAFLETKGQPLAPCH